MELTPVQRFVATLVLAALAVTLLVLNVDLTVNGIRSSSRDRPSAWDWLWLSVPLSGVAVAVFRGWNTRHFAGQPPGWRVAITTLLAMEALIFVFLITAYASSITI